MKAGAIDEHSARDAVTGLPGMDAVRARLEDWARPVGPGDELPSVHALLLGLPRLDALNLAYGAAAGDVALSEVAARLSHFAADELSGPWLAARGRGGSFVLVANEACSRERWQLFAAQLADLAARPIVRTGGTVRLSPRIALLRGMPGETALSILDRLGQTLDLVNRQQGRRVMWADGVAGGRRRTSAQLETDLLAAIDRDEIEVLYQPQFALPGDRLSGGEALARWDHPQLGRIGAGALFAVAERADYVAPLSRHIARKALAGAARWPAPLRLSLNVTPADFAAADFAPSLLATVRDSGFPTERLTLEVTEQVLLGDIHTAAEALRFLSASGIRIALDDFGAGFCNFRYLKLLPLDYLKLDRSMVEGIATDPRDLAVLRAIVAMARALNLEVIAEGIETEAQHRAIGEEGCGYFQGFLRAAPLSAAEFLKASG